MSKEQNEIAQTYTWVDICESYVKFKGLNMTGKQFFEASPTGELYHVFDAYEEMKEAGFQIEKVGKKNE